MVDMRCLRLVIHIGDFQALTAHCLPSTTNKKLINIVLSYTMPWRNINDVTK